MPSLFPGLLAACMVKSGPKKQILVFSKQYMYQSTCQVDALVSIPASTTNYHVDRHTSSAELANMFIKACSLSKHTTPLSYFA